jgi:hypothetical protein
MLNGSGIFLLSRSLPRGFVRLGAPARLLKFLPRGACLDIGARNSGHKKHSKRGYYDCDLDEFHKNSLLFATQSRVGDED